MGRARSMREAISRYDNALTCRASGSFPSSLPGSVVYYDGVGNRYSMIAFCVIQSAVLFAHDGDPVHVMGVEGR